MALNFQQVFDKIREIGLGARSRRENLERLREQASGLLEAWADKSAELNEKLEHGRQSDPSLRCAIPLAEPLDARRDPTPAPAHLTLIAADGSQIAPDRHAAVLYSLVNVGAIVMQTGSGLAPAIFPDSHLLFDDEIYTETGILTTEAIELQRDIAERRKLLELAKQVSGRIVALTDGPVELWGVKNGGEQDYRKNLEIHKSILSQLQARGVTVAGYVDKPGADLVVRLLEIARLSSDDQFKDIRKQHSLRGVTDRWLYGRILKGGQRSAVFGMQSGSRAHYTGDLALHFFYLNVGDEKYPSLVRVEIPKWVADDEEKLNLLHATLLDQCRMMGARPYPYILHRAHEIAVVKFKEKQQVEQMLELELRKSGGEVDEQSSKQSAKDLPGRKR
ncbi:MAG: DNA double-strand break repair nuclease NurA [Chloroflexi bacterium]|nr:DNA double-strand break repair nuclease NurA [Chloroflexota bacterium]